MNACMDACQSISLYVRAVCAYRTYVYKYTCTPVIMYYHVGIGIQIASAFDEIETLNAWTHV